MKPLRIYVEGASDIQAAVKIATAAGFEATKSSVISMNGHAAIDSEWRKLQLVAQEAKIPTWVLRDVDPLPPNLKGHRAKQCAPNLLRKLGAMDQHNGPWFRMRLAQYEIEAWFLADSNAMESYFAVPASELPLKPDAEMHPKETLLYLAQRNQDTKGRDWVKEKFIAHDGERLVPGTLYAKHMNGFAAGPWAVAAAAKRSDSLRRCLRALRQFKAKHT